MTPWFVTHKGSSKGEEMGIRIRWALSKKAGKTQVFWLETMEFGAYDA